MKFHNRGRKQKQYEPIVVPLKNESKAQICIGWTKCECMLVNSEILSFPPLLSTTVSNDSNFFPHLLPIQTSGIFANVSGSRSISIPTSASASTSTLVYKPFTFHFPYSKTRKRNPKSLRLSLFSISIYIPKPYRQVPQFNTPWTGALLLCSYGFRRLPPKRCRIAQAGTPGPRSAGTGTRWRWTRRKVGDGERTRWWRSARTAEKRVCRRRGAKDSNLSRYLRPFTLVWQRRRLINESLSYLYHSDC